MFKVAVPPANMIPPINIVSMSSTKVKPFLFAKNDFRTRFFMANYKER